MTAAFVLLPYQRSWVADRSEVKVAEKSRRIGLSWADSCGAVLAGAPAAGWQDTWYIGYTKDMAEQYILDAANWARAMNVAAQAIEDAEDVLDEEDRKAGVKAFRVTLSSGARITALSSRPRNLRSKKGRVTIDEAAFHDDLAELLKAALALLIWGAQISIISTHDGVENAFNELIGEIRAGKWPYAIHRITFDDALADGLFRRICLSKGQEWSPEAEVAFRAKIFALYGSNAQEELLCVPRNSGGAFFSRALLESRMVDAPVIRKQFEDGFEFKPEPERVAVVQDWLNDTLRPLLAALEGTARSFFGMDFGRTGDRSVIAPIVAGQALSRRIPFLVELGNAPFRVQEQILFYIADRLPMFMAGALDATGNGAFLAEVAAQRYGSTRIAQVKLSEEWYREEMPRYKAAFEDDQISIPRDADVLDDHRAIVVVKGVPKIPATGRTKGSDGKQRHGDAAVACALAWFAARLDVAPIEYLSLGQTRVGMTLADYLGG
jgi:phage FluMu gp28-like protein